MRDQGPQNNRNPLRRGERGNIFFTLFGAVAIVGVLGAGIMATMRGPLSTMVEVNKRTKADTEMAIASKLALLEAVESLAGGGDCDGDGFVEPLEYKDAGAGDKPVGGGYLPDAIGSTKEDPWGNSYGYCAWDAGTTIDDAACDDNSSASWERLNGTGDADETYTVIAVISAGPDGLFQTTCAGGASPDVTKTAGSDDIIVSYSYEGAAAGTDGLWDLKTGDPTTAEIAKNIEAQGAKFSGNLDLTAASAQLQLGAMSMLLPDQTALTTCNAANDGLMRRNTSASPTVIEACYDGTGWVELGSSKWEDGTTAGEIYYNSGNVGIGLTDPAQPLDVAGNIQLSGDAMLSAGKSVVWASGAGVSESSGAIEIDANGGTGPAEIDVDADTVTIIAATSITGDTVITGSTTGVTTVDALTVEDSAGTDILVVQNDGKVGIGKADPTDTLDAAGNATVSGAYKIDGNTVLNSDTTMAGTILLGNAAGANVTGDNNTLLGAGSGATLVEGTNNILIGQGVDVAAPADSDRLIVGNLLFGTMTAGSEALDVGTAAVNVDLNVKGDLDVEDTIYAAGNISSGAAVSATGNVTAGSQIFVNGDQLGPPLACTSSEKLEWNNGTGWSCVTDLQGGAGGGAATLEDVLTNGNDANGLNAVDLGKVGAGEYCNADLSVCTLAGDLGGADELNDLADALTDYITGKNMALGLGSAAALAGGENNLFIGQDSGALITVEDYNTLLGYQTGQDLVGSFNTFIGERAGGDATAADSNVFVGRRAGEGAGGGDENVFIGKDAGISANGASNNVFIGALTGTSVTGSGNILIGHDIDPAVAGTSEYLNIGGILLGDIGTTSTDPKIGAYKYCDENLTNCFTATDITDNTEGDDSLVLHLALDDSGNDSTADDSSGNGNNGTLTNFPADPSANWVSGKVGGGLDFDGTDDYVELSHNSAFDTVPLSVSVWFRLDQLPSAMGSNEVLLYRKHSGSPWFAWQLTADATADKIKFTVKDAGEVSYNVKSDAPLTANAWYHAVAVLKADYALELFINGIKQAETANSGSLFVADNKLFIGGRQGPNELLDGLIDDVRLYSRALTPSEIKGMYYSGAGGGRWEDGLTAGDIHYSGGKVGIGTNDPKTALDVNGSARIADGGETCAAAIEGAIRYRTTIGVEYCDGTAWRVVTTVGTGINLVITPAADTNMDVDGTCGTPTCTGTTVTFTVTNVGDQTSDPLSYSLTGDTGNFTVVGETCTGATLGQNQTCQIDIEPSADGNYIYSATLTVPHHNSPDALLQGQGSNFGCAPGAAAFGGIYAACNLTDGTNTYDLIVTPGGCDGTLNEPTCSGTDSIQKTYGSTGKFELAQSYQRGDQNTVNLDKYYTSGAGSFPGAQYCMDMVYNGYSDWYLPARDELRDDIFPNYSAIGGFANDWYQTSTAAGWDNNRYEIVHRSGGITSTERWSSRYVRCARRHDVALPAAQPDTDPDDIAFATKFASAAGQRISSDVKTVTGITPGVSVSIAGPGSPTFKINGGAEVTSGTVQWNDTVQIVMDSPAAGSRNQADITIGTDTFPFSVITEGDCGGAGCTGVDKRVFVMANATVDADALGGINGADAICQAEADTAFLGGTWKAILSAADPAEWAANRMDYNWDRLVNMNGDVIAISPADLWDGTLSATIDYDATGSALNGVTVTTATLSNGVTASIDPGSTLHCIGWTGGHTSSPTGGSSGSLTGWVENAIGLPQCRNAGHRFYCQEVNAPTINLVLTPVSQTGMDVTGPGAPATGAAVTFTVQNQGTAPSAAIATSVTNAVNFEILNDTCNGNTLAPTASCTLDVRPRAYADGSYNGTLQVTDGAVSDDAGLFGTASGFATDIGIWLKGDDVGDIYYNDGPVGIGTTDPDIALDVVGSVKIGNGGEVCDAAIEGALRYRTTVGVEYCDGAAWTAVAVVGTGVVLSINPPNKLDMDVTGPGNPASGTNVVFNVTNTGAVTSNALSYTLSNTTNFTVTSDTCTGNTLAPAASCQIEITPQATADGTFYGTLSIPQHNNPQATLQGTGSNFGCYAGQPAYGGIVMACDMNGPGVHIISMPGGCDGTTSEPTCAGNDTGVVQRIWGGSGYVITGAKSGTNGAQNTANIIQYSAVPGPYPAAEYCANMVYQGYDDWYLPAPDEWDTYFPPVKDLVGGFSSDANPYWASEEASSTQAYMVTPGGSIFSNRSKTANSDYVRCFRREGEAFPVGQPDTDPDDIAFATKFAAAAAQRISSDVKTVTGITPGVAVSIAGDGSPTFKINGGAEVTSGTVQWNDTVQVVMDSPAAGSRNQADITIGTDTFPFSVITEGDCGGAGCAGVDKRVFVTSTTYTGNMGGLVGADAKCQTQADAAALGGTWQAILSAHSAHWAVNRMDYNWDRLVNMNGDVIATSPADLWDGSLSNAVGYDENANLVTDGVWTGSNSDGTLAVPSDIYKSCDSWTYDFNVTTNKANSGNSGATSASWIDIGSDKCSLSKRLYCQEVNAPTINLVLTPVSQTGMDVTGPGAPATGAAVTFTVQNQGTAASAAIATSVTNAVNFEILNDTCNGNTLAPTASCTLDVRPRAYADGSYNGTLQVTDGAVSDDAGLFGTASGFATDIGIWLKGDDVGDIYYNDGPVGIGTTDPDIALDVVGSVKIGNGGEVCGATVAGAIKYDSGVMYMCDGTQWEPINTGVGGLWSDSGAGYIEYDNALGGVKIGSVTGEPAPVSPFEWLDDGAGNLHNKDGGKVGVGLSAPAVRLDVAGSLKIADGGETCDGTLAGAMKYDSGTMYMCDGTGWEAVNTGAGGLWTDLTGGRIHFGSAGTEQAGVATNDPKATLHVGGEAIFGNTGATCDADREGGLRWNTTDDTFEMCDGATWRKIAATAAAADCTPDAFTFTDLTDQPLSMLVTSNTVNITGIDPGCSVSVTGGGSPQISVNGGAWTTSTSINPGDTLQARLTSSGSVSTALVATVNVGGTTDDWSVTTKAGSTRIFITTNGYRGDSLGGIGGAHTICQTEAGTLGYGGIWRALISNESIDAKDLLTITYPVVRASDATVVDSINLWDGSLENNVSATGQNYALTGSLSDGTKSAGETCDNWSGGTGNGRVGAKTENDNRWIYRSAFSCSQEHGIYCVEQASALGAVLTISPPVKTAMHVFGSGSPATGDAVTFTVENVGDTTSATIATSLSNTTNFEIVADTCDGNTLAGFGATCTIDVRPRATIPGGEGPISGTLTVTANNNPSAAMSGYASAGATKIFKTSGVYRGDSIGGLAAADTICQTEAGNLGYSGTWKALMSDATTNVRDRVTITYPVVLASETGTIIDSVDLWDGSLENAIGNADVFTGSNSDGTKHADTCSSWSASGTGMRGTASKTDGEWMTRGSTSCGGTLGLYCVEQPGGGTINLNFTPSSQSGMDVAGPGSPAYGSPVTFTLQNTGTGTSGALSTSITGGNFEIVTDNCAGNTLAPAATCTIDVRPMASANGTYTGTLGAQDPAVSANAGLSGAATGFSGSVVGLWTQGADDDIYYNTGVAPMVGIGLTDPLVRLDVAGSLKIADGGETCDGTLAGAMKYDSGTMYMCDGTGWEAVNTGAGGLWTDLTGGRIHFGSAGTEQAGVAMNDPKATLHVAGEAIFGNTGATCDADREGGLRWNTTDDTFEMCDGATWRKIAATAAAADCTPDAFTFTDLTDQPLSMLIASNTVNITGIDAGCSVSVTGGGSPQISVNGGAWVTATVIDPGDTLQARLTSSGSVSTALVATVTVGATPDSWSVTTKAGSTRIFKTPNTYRGDSLGGIGGAHTLCQTEAGTLGYGGIWRALLSNDGIDAKDLLTITYPVVRASDATVVDSVNIWDGSLENSMGSGTVWTGTKSNGTKDSITCDGWRGSGQGRDGNGGLTDSRWIEDAVRDCTTTLRGLFCVEQASALGAVLTITPSTKTDMNIFGSGSPATGDAVTFTVENVGDTTSATIATSLSNTTNFEIVADTCDGNTLAGFGATCTVDIRPKATIPGTSSWSGTFNVAANNNPSASLSGIAAGTQIFRTNSTFTGGTIGSLANADALCQAEAGTFGYSGTWKALLSDASTNAKDRVTIVYPVVRASNNNEIVDSINLWDGSLEQEVAPDSNQNSSMWTGTQTDGTKDADTCNSWTDTAANGAYAGANNTNSAWIDSGSTACSSGRRLYCVEQPGSGTINLNFTPSSQSGMDVAGPGSPAYGSPVTFTLQNSGTGTSGALSTSITGGNFEIVTDNCAGNTLAPTATCTIDVRPMASANGTYTGTLGAQDPAVSANAGLSGAATGFSGSVVGLWTQGADDDIYYNTGVAPMVGIGLTDPGVALDVAGDIEYTGTLTDVSDRRLKTDIAPLGARGSMLDRLAEIDTYSFRMKGDEAGRTEFGVMAQELERVFPELVRTAEDEMGTKSVNYVGLIAPVIEASKELKAENAALKAEIEELGRQVDRLNQTAGRHAGKASGESWMLMALLLLLGCNAAFFLRHGKTRRPKK